MESIVSGKKWWKATDGDSDNEQNDGDKKNKWKSLEHHGVTFFPTYQPHGVKILFKVSLPK